MSQKIVIAGFELTRPVLMNGGGGCRDTGHVRGLAASEADIVNLGPITPHGRNGNTGQVFYAGDKGRYCLNSIGLRNPGIPFYRPLIPAMAEISHDAGKPLIANIAADTPSEYTELTESLLEAGADLVEQNWSCGNKWSGALQGQIPVYDPVLAQEILDRTHQKVGATRGRVIIKVSWLDPFSLRAMAERFASYPWIAAVTAINTLANALAYDEDGNPRITPGGGLAGFSGPAYLPIAVGQVKQWRDALPERIAVFGCGGINDEYGMRQHFFAGAAALQVGSYIYDEGRYSYHRFAQLKRAYLALQAV